MQNILNFTNIDNEDFVGQYHGEFIPVKAGETKTFTENVVRHIAGQLATKILIRKRARNYLTDRSREGLIKEMMGEVVIQEPVNEEEPEEVKVPEKKEEEFADLKKPTKKTVKKPKNKPKRKKAKK